MPTYKFPGLIITSRYKWTITSVLVAGALVCGVLFVVLRWIGDNRVPVHQIWRSPFQRWHPLPATIFDHSQNLKNKINPFNNDYKETGYGYDEKEDINENTGRYDNKGINESDKEPMERSRYDERTVSLRLQKRQLHQKMQQKKWQQHQQRSSHHNKRRRLTKKQRLKLIESQRGRCGICDKVMEDYEIAIDHRVPLAARRLGVQGDLNADWNLWAICVLCHARKCRLEAQRGLYRRN